MKQTKAVTVAAALAAVIGLVGCSGPSTPAPQSPDASPSPVESPSGNEGNPDGATGKPVALADLDLLAAPRDYVGPSTAVLPDQTVSQLVEPGEPQLPATVTSYDRGGEIDITVTDTSRVIALGMSSNIASLVYGLGFGDSLVGRDISTDFAGTEHLPVVTHNGHSIDAESILKLDPSLIITDGSVGPLDVLLQLRDVGIPVVMVERDPSFEGTYRNAEQVGAALGVPEAGVELANILRAEVEAKAAEIAQITPANSEDRVRMAFLYLRGSAGIYYLFGSESGVDALVPALGGIDAAGEAGWNGMQPVNDEALVLLNPDLIFVMSGGLESMGGIDGMLETLPALALTNAGQNRRFVDMHDDQILGFGPRSAEILDALARAVYAPDSLG